MSDYQFVSNEVVAEIERRRDALLRRWLDAEGIGYDTLVMDTERELGSGK